MTNDPFEGGTHSCDIALIKPIFVEDRLFAFAISVAHWSEVGGGRARQHLAHRDRDLSGGRALPRHPRLPGRRDHRRRDRADPRERALAGAIPRRFQRRARRRAHRRDAAPRGPSPLRHPRGQGHLRPYPGNQPAPEPGRRRGAPRRRLRRRRLDRWRRHFRGALPRRGHRPHPGRHHHLRFHRHQPDGSGADQLRLRCPRFGGQDRVQVAGGPAGALQRGLVPPGEPGLPARHRVHRREARAHRLVLRGLRPRLRACLEGAGRSRARALQRGLLHEPRRHVFLWPRPGERRGLRPHRARHRRLGCDRVGRRHQRAHRHHRRRHLQLFG